MLGFAPNVNTPDGLLFVKLKFVVLLPNWKTEPIQIKQKYPINDTILFKIDFDLDILNLGKIKILARRDNACLSSQHSGCRGERIYVSSKPAWVYEPVSGQPGLLQNRNFRAHMT